MLATRKSLGKKMTASRAITTPGFVCRSCGMTFESRNGLLLHLKSHLVNDGDMLPCTTCQQSFRTAALFNAHKCTPPKPAALQCDSCLTGFVGATQLRIHLRDHPRCFGFASRKDSDSNKPQKKIKLIEPLTLSSPPLVDSRRPPLDKLPCPPLPTKNLQEDQVEPTKFICAWCPKTFAKNTYLLKHVKTHAKAIRNTCNLCKIEFFHTRHFLSHHCTGLLDAPAKYVCHLCNKECNSRASKHYHLKAKHGFMVSSAFPCELCDLKLPDQAQLWEHVCSAHSPL